MNVFSEKNGPKIDISLVCRNHSSIPPYDYTDYVWLRYETELLLLNCVSNNRRHFDNNNGHFPLGAKHIFI